MHSPKACIHDGNQGHLYVPLMCKSQMRVRGTHTGIMGVLPPHSSGSKPASLSSCFTLSGLAPSLSICRQATAGHHVWQQAGSAGLKKQPCTSTYIGLGWPSTHNTHMQCVPPTYLLSACCCNQHGPNCTVKEQETCSCTVQVQHDREKPVAARKTLHKHTMFWSLMVKCAMLYI